MQERLGQHTANRKAVHPTDPGDRKPVHLAFTTNVRCDSISTESSFGLEKRLEKSSLATKRQNLDVGLLR